MDTLVHLSAPNKSEDTLDHPIAPNKSKDTLVHPNARIPLFHKSSFIKKLE